MEIELEIIRSCTRVWNRTHQVIRIDTLDLVRQSLEIVVRDYNIWYSLLSIVLLRITLSLSFLFLDLGWSQPLFVHTACDSSSCPSCLGCRLHSCGCALHAYLNFALILSLLYWLIARS